MQTYKVSNEKLQPRCQNLLLLNVGVEGGQEFKEVFMVWFHFVLFGGWQGITEKAKNWLKLDSSKEHHTVVHSSKEVPSSLNKKLHTYIQITSIQVNTSKKKKWWKVKWGLQGDNLLLICQDLINNMSRWKKGMYKNDQSDKDGNT